MIVSRCAPINHSWYPVPLTVVGPSARASAPSAPDAAQPHNVRLVFRISRRWTMGLLPFFSAILANPGSTWHVYISGFERDDP
jgi:hypothetical protein